MLSWRAASIDEREEEDDGDDDCDDRDECDLEREREETDGAEREGFVCRRC